jgi:heme-degrading monooxygenase HmoA
MQTVMTETTVKPGRERDWDNAFHDRAMDARRQPGWVDLHLLVPQGDERTRVVVGSWQDRESWERWHETETFKRTREQLNDATETHGEDRWFDVIEQQAKPSG